MRYDTVGGGALTRCITHITYSLYGPSTTRQSSLRSNPGMPKLSTDLSTNDGLRQDCSRQDMHAVQYHVFP